jgi:hypothetical protein
MLRKFGGIVSIVAAVLCIVILVEWMRSRHYADVVLFRTPAGHSIGSAGGPGGLLLVQSDLPYDGAVDVDGREHALRLFSPTADEFRPIRDALFDTTLVKFSFLGFKTAAGQIALSTSLSPRFSAILLPYWALVVVLAILASGVGRAAWTGRHRRRHGLCIACGYDLRASTGRCPECGKGIPAKA